MKSKLTPLPKIYGLIGKPVRHSLSPLMHNAAFKALKIDAEYRLFELEADRLEHFLYNMGANNILGVNVTVPYKEKVMPFLDKVSAEAKAIGAVNTIKLSQDSLEGFNTDGEGFLWDLTKNLKFNPEGKSVAIIGAGGAARAVCVYLSKAHVKKISIFDIEAKKRDVLVEHLKRSFPDMETTSAEAIDGLRINKRDLLINATPIGMRENDPCLVDEKLLHKNILVYDLIYNPAETRLIKAARQIGARASGGLGMLLCQGARSFEIWRESPAPIEAMELALKEGVKKI
ncbi:MAG: shikimate dehydrogenase [Candidatus Omnitrophota bacterium]